VAVVRGVAVASGVAVVGGVGVPTTGIVEVGLGWSEAVKLKSRFPPAFVFQAVTKK
jgi:hypothetical protein